jgi:hypothetical protein
VQTILRGHTRQEQEAFLVFRSHYLFAAHFCTPNEPQEKGRVEHRVGFARRQYFVPLPQVASFAELNAHLLACCERDDVRVVQGESVSIGTAWQQEQPLLRSLPERPLDYAVTRLVRLNRYSQVEFETNRYSVPVDQARATLTLNAHPFTITICDAQQVIATHPRCYAHQQDILDPLQYSPPEKELDSDMTKSMGYRILVPKQPLVEFQEVSHARHATYFVPSRNRAQVGGAVAAGHSCR